VAVDPPLSGGESEARLRVLRDISGELGRPQHYCCRLQCPIRALALPGANHHKYTPNEAFRLLMMPGEEGWHFHGVAGNPHRLGKMTCKDCCMQFGLTVLRGINILVGVRRCGVMYHQ